MNKNFKVKKNDGLSLIELIISLALLATVVPIFFGIFFANLDIENGLALKNESMTIANDLKNFIKISDYNYIYNLATGNELLGVKNVDENKIVTRKFEKYDIANHYDYICKLSLISQNHLMKFCTNIDDSCGIPVWCEVFYAKTSRKRIEQLPVLQKSKTKVEFPVVKLR